MQRDGDGMVQKELAQFMGVEAPTLVRLLDRLAAEGFVVRRPLHGTNVSGERQRPGMVVPWSTSGAGPQAKPKAPAVGHFPGDRRANTVHLSTRAHEVLKELNEVAAALRGRRLDGIPADRLADCRKALETIIAKARDVGTD